MNTIGYFEIQSSDPAREKAFYAAVFGWNFVLETHLPIEYYRIETGTMYGGLLKRPAAVPPLQSGTNAFTCSVQVTDFDATAARILEQGGQVALPKFAVPGRCWQGYFIDPDNNTFGVFEVDASAQ
jgi:uncharacterized protein